MPIKVIRLQKYKKHYCDVIPSLKHKHGVHDSAQLLNYERLRDTNGTYYKNASEVPTVADVDSVFKRIENKIDANMSETEENITKSLNEIKSAIVQMKADLMKDKSFREEIIKEILAELKKD